MTSRGFSDDYLLPSLQTLHWRHIDIVQTRRGVGWEIAVAWLLLGVSLIYWEMLIMMAELWTLNCMHTVQFSGEESTFRSPQDFGAIMRRSGFNADEGRKRMVFSHVSGTNSYLGYRRQIRRGVPCFESFWKVFSSLSHCLKGFKCPHMFVWHKAAVLWV